MFIDNCKAQEALESDEVKSSPLLGDKGSIARKIRELEKKHKVSFEFGHIKTRGDDNNQKDLRGNMIILQCDEKAKVERQLCCNDHQNKRIDVRGIMCLMCENEMLEKSISEVDKCAEGDGM